MRTAYRTLQRSSRQLSACRQFQCAQIHGTANQRQKQRSVAWHESDGQQSRSFYHASTSASTTGAAASNDQIRSMSTSKGLFSIDGLIQPSDFHEMADQAIAECDNMRAELSHLIANQTSPSSLHQAKSMLFELDQISRTVCNVIDAAELCRSAHSSEEWRSEAQNVFETLNEYISTLNGDTDLYEALVQVAGSSFFNQLEEEEQRFAVLLKQEFELEGIHLSQSDRQLAQQYQMQVANAESQFMNNITNARKMIQIEADLIESFIPKSVLQANGAIYGSATSVGVDASSPIAHTLASHATDADLRRQVYHEMHTTAPENLQVLKELRRMRHDISTHLGFESYAHRFLQDKMAKTPQAVIAFLRQVQSQTTQGYRQDMAYIAHAKQQVEGTADEVEPWDLKFYTKLLKAQRQFGGLDQAEMAPYLNLDNCITTLQFLVTTLFGIDMKEETVSAAERWDGFADTATQGIRKFVFEEKETQRPLGTMYLDLHPRPGKYTHAAHFTVRCGCLQNFETNEFQLPVIALVCNMNTGSASFSTHSEVETLFHEFGHALHSLLSRTKFQHLSGTRGSLDFVETPSHWMEHYVWDEQTITTHLAKAGDGSPMPPELVQALLQSKKALSHLELQTQIALAMFDQEIFSKPPGVENTDSTAAIWKSVHQQANLPFSDKTHSYTTIGHVVTYGAGYYGYLFAQNFADDIWKELFSQNPWNRSSGELLWKKLLQHGGSRDPNSMLKDLLGPTRKEGHKVTH